MKLYLVGGTIRDKLLDKPFNNDIDFAVEAPSYDIMKSSLISTLGLKIWQEREAFTSLRGHIPLEALPGRLQEWLPPPAPHDPTRAQINADFTLCRKDGFYSDSRHPDTVEPTDIYDDLSRRDFTINAIAVDEAGNVLDPFNGQTDLTRRLLQTVGHPGERFAEDPLRLLRALRFCVTHRLKIADHTNAYMLDQDLVDKLEHVSTERIQTELHKAFVADTMRVIELLYYYHRIARKCFTDKLWVKPTMEAR